MGLDQDVLPTREQLDTPDDGEFERGGLSKPVLVKVLKELINAKEVKAQIPTGGNEFVYSKRLKDNTTRLRAVELAFKLRGMFPAEKIEHGGGITVNYNVEPINKE